MSVIEPDENELGDGLADLERRRHSAGVQRGLRVAAKGDFTHYPERHTATGKSSSATKAPHAPSWSRTLRPWERCG